MDEQEVALYVAFFREDLALALCSIGGMFCDGDRAWRLVVLI